VPIVDNLVRALPTVAEHARDMRAAPREELECVVDGFDREAALDAAEHAIRSSEPP
jgi:4-phosphopantoate--beta-alanine ligase